MTTAEPQPIPIIALIKRIRRGARPGISIAKAAKLGGVSEPRWMQLEKGSEKRRGIVRPADNPRSETIAGMAYGVNRAAGHILITPEMLADEGAPEAADLLRETMRQDAERPEPVPVLPAAGILPDDIAGHAEEFRPFLIRVMMQERAGEITDPWEMSVFSDPLLDEAAKRSLVAWSRWAASEGRLDPGDQLQARLTPGPEQPAARPG